MNRLAGLIALAAGPVLVLLVFFVLPVSGMIDQGLRPDGRLDLGGVFEVLTRPRTRRVLWFTVWSAVLGTVLTLLLGIPAAYALHRLKFPGRRLLRTILLVPFVLPTVVVGVAFRGLISEAGPLGGLGLDGSPWAIIAALVFFNLAVVVRTVGSAWESLDPRPGEAAAALGASPWQVARAVTFPQLRGAIVSAASVVFLFCATAFGVVLILGGATYATVETEIYLLTVNIFDLPAAAALSLVQLLVVTLLLYGAHRARAADPMAVERRTVRPIRPRLIDLPALVATTLALILVLLPVGSLIVTSLHNDHGWTLEHYRALNDVSDNSDVLVPVTEALRNSLAIAVDATWMSLVMGLLVALVVTRRSHSVAERRVRGGLDAFFMLPLGVSAVTLGFGFLITLDTPPLDLRDSPLLVPIAQALVALPLVVRTLVPVLASIDDRQRQAAASLGASPLRTLVTVDLAVIWKPLLVAAGFAYAVSLGEFGASSFLVRDERPTLPVVIGRLLTRPDQDTFATALAASVVLAATTALVMVVVERLRVPGMGGF